MTEKNNIQAKFTELFRGGSPFPKRLLLSLGPALAVSFTLFFYGPLDLAYISRDYVAYTAADLLRPAGLIAVVIFLILLAAAAVPGGEIHRFLVSAYTGAALALYIQGMFLNPDLGTLDGHVINWTSYSTLMVIDLAVWAAILLLPFLIRHFSVSGWRFFAVLIPAALVIMQGASLTGTLIKEAQTGQERSASRYLSAEDMFSIGRERNIIVFLLDTVSNQDIADMTAKYPEALAPFHDFTRFDNANTR